MPFRLENQTGLFATYAGSSSCRECHSAAYELWSGSHHALAERPVDAQRDGSAFDPPRRFRHGTQKSEARSTNGQFEVLTLGFARHTERYRVERVIGASPLRQFLVKAPGGRYHPTEVAFDPRRSDWFNVFGDEDRVPGDWGHWTGRGMVWNSMCAACHNTRLRKNYDPATDTFSTAVAEMGVGCEACHGPMAGHVSWRRQHPKAATTDPTIVRFSRDQVLDTCGSCHARRSELTGDFHPGEKFFDHYSLAIPDESSIFYPDGQVQDEDYEFTSFLASRMHQAGVRCVNCHEPHSGRTRESGNLLCMGCHNNDGANVRRIDPEAHAFHPIDRPGGLCVDCHMPLTTYMQRHPRRDHGFTIPDPLLTKTHGIPNACNRCHANRDADWALGKVERWYGNRMDRPSRRRARWVAEARAGEPAAHGNLIRLYREEKNPLWRAVAVGLMRRWMFEPAVASTLAQAAEDPEPIVRGSAALAVEPAAQHEAPLQIHAMLQTLLRDPVRKVRVDAAWALRASLDTNSAAGIDLVHYLRHVSDQPGGILQMGVLYLDRGQPDAAIQYFARAVDWDPNSAPLRHDLALALSRLGRAEDAVRELEAACRLDPSDAELRFKLGLALNEAGKLRQGVAALGEAVRLDATHDRAWYNLGLAYSELSEPQRALDALLRAESLNRASPRIPYARATILARMGRIHEARAAAARALQVNPGYGDAAALLRRLSTQWDRSDDLR